MTVYADLFGLPERDRIDAIGKAASQGALVGFIVEDDEKADRYIAKLTEKYKRIRVVDRMAGPVPNTVLVRVGPRAH